MKYGKIVSNIWYSIVVIGLLLMASTAIKNTYRDFAGIVTVFSTSEQDCTVNYNLAESVMYCKPKKQEYGDLK